MAEEDVLDVLEAEAIHILREVAGAFRRPVLLYSIGKDSSVLLHLATKAFAPGRMPFPVLHIDTGWKFREMIAFRDDTARRLGLDLQVRTNPERATPFTHGAHEYTRLMKTVVLRQALDDNGFDAAIGGARRDEERSRAKERIFSLREPGHRWEPRSQRPEFWWCATPSWPTVSRCGCSPCRTGRSWTSGATSGGRTSPWCRCTSPQPRPVVERNGSLIMVDDERFPLEPGERPQPRQVRFRTLGCYPLTAAVESKAENLDEVIDEMRLDRRSERAGRLIDGEGGTSIESKKSEGYF